MQPYRKTVRQLNPRLSRFALAVIAIVIGSTLSPIPAVAQTQQHVAEHLDPRVAYVVTGGDWQEGDAGGMVRIVVLSGGFEHVTSLLFVQWLATDPDSVFPRVVRTEEVREFKNASWALSDPRIVWNGHKWFVTVNGADSHMSPPRAARWRLDIGEPGEIRLSRMPEGNS